VSAWTCGCGTANPNEARFCGNCGRGRPASSPPERAEPASDARASRLGWEPAPAGPGAREGAYKPPPKPDPWIGQLVMGRYRVVSVIGEGAMGIVYRAEQKMGQATRPVALKLLHAAYTSDEALRARFLRECEVVVSLEHPNTIKFYDFGELEDGSLAIVMEFIDGESLADRLERGPIPPQQALHIVGQICGSLHEAHARGIIHRDLKPENILLASRADESDIVKVCDFGIAKTVGLETEGPQLTLAGMVVGTPPYMSPEQVSSGDLDGRSDIYSLGVMTYEMLTGRYPFADARSVFEWAQRHLHATPMPIDQHPIAEAISPRARAAIMRSLAKQREQRQATVLEFAREILAEGQIDQGWGLSTHLPSRSVAETALMTSQPAAFDLPQTSHGGVRTPHVPTPPPKKGSWLAPLLVLSLLLGAASALAVFFAFIYEPPGQPRTQPEPPPEDAAVMRPVEDDGLPDDWMRSVVSASRGVESPGFAVGAGDDRYATIPRNGTLLLELAPGATITTDHGEDPDMEVFVPDISGPYRVEVAADGEHFFVIVSDVAGTVTLDLDQYEIVNVRYVRITARGSRPVLLDAIGVFRVGP
jgi:serine/threonine protein kinase